MNLPLFLSIAAVLLVHETKSEKPTTCPCGWINHGRIVGGKETKKNEFPWMAGLHDVTRRFTLCGAAIITRFHGLTAGHCVEKENAAHFALLVGAHDTRKGNEGVKVPIERFVIHPTYNRRAYQSDDIAVIVTRDLIPVTPTIGPVCLPSTRINLVNQKIKAIGWGQVGFTAPGSPVLKAADLTVIPHDKCRKQWADLPVPQSQICTEDRGKSTCHGDSGGPLVWLDRETNRYTLVGVTSYGKECVTPPGAVDTEVSVYVPWIEKVVAETKPVNTCKKV